MSGKGSTPRKVDSKLWSDGWDRIFGKELRSKETKINEWNHNDIGIALAKIDDHTFNIYMYPSDDRNTVKIEKIATYTDYNNALLTCLTIISAMRYIDEIRR